MTDQRPDHRAETGSGPLSPKPGALVIVLLLVGGLIYNLRLDAMSEGYDGKYFTFAIVGLIAGILGVDLSRFWRGRDEK